MAKFTADSVEALEYDFTKFVPECKGTIPEPSGKAFEQFTEVLKNTFKTRTENGKTVLDTEATAAALESNEIDEDTLYDALGEFTNGHPSSEDIRALPYRVQRAFIGWIMGEFYSPEA